MITLSNISFKYPSTSSNSLKDISLHIKKGECVLLCGHSGCGKTTLTRLINGLIPHFYEGELTGEVTVDQVNVSNTELYELASKVGSVFQNPKSQFFCVDSTGEVAFGCENLGLPKTEIIKRIDSVSLEMNMTDLLDRNIFCLSGGEKQKIACASVAAMAPDVWVLDEPTSNLDIKAIGDLKRTLKQWKAQGKTIIIAEHRLYWLTDLCDRVVYMKDGKIDFDFSMATFNQLSEVQVDQLGLRTRCLSQINFYKKQNSNYTYMQLENFKYIGKGSKVPRLDIDKLKLPQNAIIAIIGDNGAGKSTFTRCLCGLENKFKGLCKRDGSIDSGRQLLKKSYLVLQDVNHQLFCETVYEELCLGHEVQNKELQSQIIDQLNLKPLLDRHPMSLSGGQKQRVTIATALLASKPLLIFDEPTSGLDYLHMERTAKLINTCNNTSTTLIVTHDPELIIRCCDYVLHLDKGTVVSQYTLDQSGLKKLLDYFRL